MVLQPLADDIPSLYSASIKAASAAAVAPKAPISQINRSGTVSSHELTALRQDVNGLLEKARAEMENTCAEVMKVTKGAIQRGLTAHFALPLV